LSERVSPPPPLPPSALPAHSYLRPSPSPSPSPLHTSSLRLTRVAAAVPGHKVRCGRQAPRVHGVLAQHRPPRRPYRLQVRVDPWAGAKCSPAGAPPPPPPARVRLCLHGMDRLRLRGVLAEPLQRRPVPRAPVRATFSHPSSAPPLCLVFANPFSSNPPPRPPAHVPGTAPREAKWLNLRRCTRGARAWSHPSPRCRRGCSTTPPTGGPLLASGAFSGTSPASCGPRCARATHSHTRTRTRALAHAHTYTRTRAPCLYCRWGGERKKGRNAVVACTP
jgi:hypothetical protein